MVEGTLAWFKADLEARRAAFRKMLEVQGLNDEERAMWVEQLADVEVVLADVEADAIGYMAWLLAERHTALRTQIGRFTQ